MFGKLFSFKSPRPSAKPETWRQGDVFLIKIAQLPKDLKPRPPVLAEGEMTGHAHRLKTGSSARVLGDGKKLFLEVRDKQVTIEHEEHGPIELPPGDYEVRIQREYHPREIRYVID